MYDVIALGELLVDFTQCGESQSGMRLFEQNPGGAPANALCALANLGKKTAFIGKVGRDMHGDFLRETIANRGVDVSGLIQDAEVFTTLAFVELSESGERRFSFARSPGADICLRPEELDEKLLTSTRIFHFGSLSLTHEPVRSATLNAIQTAKQAGAVISYDPNYRAMLWKSKEEATRQMRSVLDDVDMIKISDEETELLTGYISPEDASNALLDKGIRCVVVTLGEKGAFVRTKDGAAVIEAFRCAAVDTTGAGDAFWGGFLYRFLEKTQGLDNLDTAAAKDCARFGNAVASLCVRKRGGIPAMPMYDEAAALYNTILGGQIS